MAVFKSIYKNHHIYLETGSIRFRHGIYRTEDPKEIEFLEKVAGVERVDEPEKQEKEKPAKIELGEEVSKKQPARKKKGE